MNRRIATRGGAAAPLLTGLFSAGEARAHEAIFGIDGYPALLLHPFTLADEIMPAIAVGLLLGSRDRGSFAPALAIYVAGLAAGGTWGELGAPLQLVWALPFGLAASAGVLVALGRQYPFPALAGVIAASGLSVGLVASGESGGLADLLQVLSAAAISTGLVVLAIAYLARGIASVVGPIPLQVAGSWLAAIALLISALVARVVL